MTTDRALQARVNEALHRGLGAGKACETACTHVVLGGWTALGVVFARHAAAAGMSPNCCRRGCWCSDGPWQDVEALRGHEGRCCTLRVACPRCGAPPAERCSYPGGQTVGTHSERERAALAAAGAAP